MSTSLFFLVILSMASLNLSYCIQNNTTIFCPETEKQSLLSFKQSLQDPNNLLSSWNSKEVNCCNWKGVYCNNFTGHVHQLHLHNAFEDGLSGQISPFLLNLKHLSYLDLSGNHFEQQIPSLIGSFKNLEYLNLSHAGFQGEIPPHIGNLTNLRVLVLESYTDLDVDSLEWLSGLSKLTHLNMNGVSLNEVTNWPQVINSLPSLTELHFKGCDPDIMAPLSHNISNSLSHLDLSDNDFDSFAIPSWIFQLTSLVFLDLSNNYLVGRIPSTSNVTKLRYIDLSENSLNSSIPNWLYFCKDLEFVSLSNNLLEGTLSSAIANLTSLNSLRVVSNQLSGKIPREIGELCRIRNLDLSNNKLQGGISDAFGNMSECFLGVLESLDLWSNQLSGHLNDQFGEFKSLQSLRLSGNSLSGAIPINIGNLSSLIYVELYDNKFTGELPLSLGKLSNLQSFYVDNNMLEGVVTESHFANLTKLEAFSASGNHLSLETSPDWIPPFQLTTLKLGSWDLGAGSQVPSWIKNQKNLEALDLSNAGISGTIPNWFWGIRFFNLSRNLLSGKVPYIDGPLGVYLSSNKFSGAFPRIGDTVMELDLSNNSFSGDISHSLCDVAIETYGLEVLHLGGNQLGGELPDCFAKMPSLRYLNLGNNNMSGTIPDSIGSLAYLRSLNLYGNKLSGQIPFSIRNCTELMKMDLADNDLDGIMPIWIGTSLLKLKILVLRSNKLSGKISSDLCCLNSLQILDLSDNKFSGTIPRCVHNFTAMATERILGEYIYTYTQSLGENFIESSSIATKGIMYQYDTILPLVTNIDLSKNNLSGDIPNELTILVELRSLNLSVNHLTDSIPDRIGDMKQLESLDFSMNSLSGQIPNSFTLLSSLNYLNLSNNRLTGRIPESTQLQSLDGSSFIGNNLCGPPLTVNCSNGGDRQDGGDEGDESKIDWFYVLLFAGYAVGFSGVCSVLVLKKSWREAYFGLLEWIWDKFYVFVYTKWTRLAKPSSSSS